MAGRGFLERSLDGLLRASDHALRAERANERPGLMQRIDPRAKLISLLVLLLAGALCREIFPLLALFLLAAALALLPAGSPRGGVVRLWGITSLFTAVIIAPALFVTPGPAIARVAGLEITATGARTAAFLYLRTMSAATFGWVLITTTPWSSILGALRSLRVPAVIVLILQMTYRYIFVLLQSAKDLLVAARSRILRKPDGKAARRVAGGLGGALLSRSILLSGDVHAAMISRGFHGDVRLLDAPRAGVRDWAVVALAIAVAATAVIIGR
ncbi:MAG: cobalt ECF transporter T component CbiQ [Thermoanaerobaculia bacterium]